MIASADATSQPSRPIIEGGVHVFLSFYYLNDMNNFHSLREPLHSVRFYTNTLVRNSIFDIYRFTSNQTKENLRLLISYSTCAEYSYI